MKRFLLPVFVLLFLAGIIGCDQENPILEEREIAFVINGASASGTATAFRSLSGTTELQITISFVNEDQSLTVFLPRETVGPLSTGKVLTYEEDGRVKLDVIFALLENSQPIESELYHLLSGTITIDEYEAGAASISLSFALEMVKAIDPTFTAKLTGSLLQVPIDE